MARGLVTNKVWKFRQRNLLREGLAELLASMCSSVNRTVAYTISKELDSRPGVNPYAPRIKQLSILDRPQNLAISYTYDLPPGPKKRFLNRAGPLSYLVRDSFGNLYAGVNTNIFDPASFGRYGTSCSPFAICSAATDPRFIEFSLKISF